MTEVKQKYFKINVEDAQKLVNYLQTRPWGEVHQFMVILINLEEVDINREVKKEK